MTRVRVLAFDLMDTLVRDPYREALVAAVDGDLADLFARRDAEAYPAFERGEIDEASYWATFGDAGFSVDPDVFHATRRSGYRWLPGMRALLEQLVDHDVRVVVASNYPSWIDEFADGMLAGLVDGIHASCHLGARKPSFEFYGRLLRALGVAPDEVLFVDDRGVNVDGARAVGLRAVRYAGVDAVVDALRAAGVLVAEPLDPGGAPADGG